MHALLAGLKSRFWVLAAESLCCWAVRCMVQHAASCITCSSNPIAVAVLPHVCLGEHAGEGLVACMYRRSASATARSVCRDFLPFHANLPPCCRGLRLQACSFERHFSCGRGRCAASALWGVCAAGNTCLTGHQLVHPTPFLMWPAVSVDVVCACLLCTPLNTFLGAVALLTHPPERWLFQGRQPWS